MKKSKGDLFTTISNVANTILPTDYGTFQMIVYKEVDTDKEHVALVKGEFTKEKQVPLVRLHSECLTGDILHSHLCDCGLQLDEALRQISAYGYGVLIYLRQEGRGIGLTNKIKAYQLQALGMDTVEANLALGFPDDAREYGVATEILYDLGISKVRLLTNNQQKIEALEQDGIEVTERCAIVMDTTEHNINYMKTKKEKMGHLI